MHHAIRCRLPDVQIKACQFHLAQAWFRKISTLKEHIEETFCEIIIAEHQEDAICEKCTDYVLKN